MYKLQYQTEYQISQKLLTKERKSIYNMTDQRNHKDTRLRTGGNRLYQNEISLPLQNN